MMVLDKEAFENMAKQMKTLGHSFKDTNIKVDQFNRIIQGRVMRAEASRIMLENDLQGIDNDWERSQQEGFGAWS